MARKENFKETIWFRANEGPTAASVFDATLKKVQAYFEAKKKVLGVNAKISSVQDSQDVKGIKIESERYAPVDALRVFVLGERTDALTFSSNACVYRFKAMKKDERTAWMTAAREVFKAAGLPFSAVQKTVTPKAWGHRYINAAFSNSEHSVVFSFSERLDFIWANYVIDAGLVDARMRSTQALNKQQKSIVTQPKKPTASPSSLSCNP